MYDDDDDDAADGCIHFFSFEHMHSYTLWHTHTQKAHFINSFVVPPSSCLPQGLTTKIPKHCLLFFLFTVLFSIYYFPPSNFVYDPKYLFFLLLYSALSSLQQQTRGPEGGHNIPEGGSHRHSLDLPHRVCLIQAPPSCCPPPFSSCCL